MINDDSKNEGKQLKGYLKGWMSEVWICRESGIKSSQWLSHLLNNGPKPTTLSPAFKYMYKKKNKVKDIDIQASQTLLYHHYHHHHHHHHHHPSHSYHLYQRRRHCQTISDKIFNSPIVSHQMDSRDKKLGLFCHPSVCACLPLPFLTINID
jgi:G3E family GTPase